MSLIANATPSITGLSPIRHDWTREEIGALFDLPFPELMFRAQTAHRQHFDPTEVQISTLLSIKTGGCPEEAARRIAPIARRARATIPAFAPRS
jgi:biotin synthase